jgi:hypothetical protein
MILTFEFSKDETQKILDSLAKEPYIDVFELINKIQKQASDQLSELDGHEDAI